MIGSHFNATPPWTSVLPGCKNCRSWWSTNSCMMDAVDVAYRRRANLDVLDNSTLYSSSPKIRRLLFQNPSQNFPTISYMKAGPVSRTQKKTGIFQHRCISHEAWIFIWKTRPMQYNSLLPLGGEVSFAPNSGMFPPNFGTFSPNSGIFSPNCGIFSRNSGLFSQMVCAGIIIVLFRSSFFVSDFARWLHLWCFLAFTTLIRRVGKYFFPHWVQDMHEQIKADAVQSMCPYISL